MQKMQAAQLVEDFSLYPRSQVDGSHVQRLSEALLAGETLPSIIVDESGRIIDGFHRRRAVMRAYVMRPKLRLRSDIMPTSGNAILTPCG